MDLLRNIIRRFFYAFLFLSAFVVLNFSLYPSTSIAGLHGNPHEYGVHAKKVNRDHYTLKKIPELIPDDVFYEKIYPNYKATSLDLTTEHTKDRYPLTHKDFAFAFTDEYYLDPIHVMNRYFHGTPEKQELIMDKDLICARAVKQHWDMRRKRVDVAQSWLAVGTAVGKILPRVKLTLNLDSLIPISITEAVEGLFGFIVPARWFTLFKNLGLARAQQYGITDLMLDRYTLAEIAYYNASKARWDFVIQNFYYDHSLEYMVPFLDKGKVNMTMYEILKNLSASVASQIIDTKIKLRTDLMPTLAYEANLVEEEKTKRFDIPIFPLPPIEKAPKLDHGVLWEKVKQYSYKLKLLRTLQAISVISVGETATTGILGDDKEGKSLSFSLGLDNITTTASSSIEVMRAVANYDQEVNKIHDTLIKAVANYNIAIDRYIMELHFLESRKHALEKVLAETLVSEKVDTLYYYATKEMMMAYMNLNAAVHTFLIAETTINRLLVTPQVEKVRRVLPFL